MKKIFKGSIVLLLMLSLIVTTKTTAAGSSDGVINGGVYKFVSKVSGKVMDVSVKVMNGTKGAFSK